MRSNLTFGGKCERHPLNIIPCQECGKEAVDQQEIEKGTPYGIIDPDYARVFSIARCLAWSEGYALLMHGSFTRDLDLLAVPWTDNVCEPEHLIRRIEDATGLRLNDHLPGIKPHGRMVWTLLFQEFGDPRWVDFGVIVPKKNAGTESR